MGVLRSFVIVIVSISLFLSILFGGITASLVLSLKYDNVQPRINTIAREIIETQIGEDEIVNNLMPYLSVYCQTNTEIVQDFQGYTFVFPCSVVKEGYYSIINYSVNYLVGDFYYKQYNCSFVKCFQDSDVPLFLVSDYARQFWKSLLFKALIASFILACLIILLVERKSNAPILIGSLLIINSLIVLSLEKIGTFAANAFLSPISMAITKENTSSILSQVVTIFFSESLRIFLYMFIGGAVLILLGILFKISGLGLKVGEKIEQMKQRIYKREEVSESDVRNIVREEMSKKNIKKKKR